MINRDQIVQIWNREAEDMWGLRRDETVGAHLLNLDSGLPTEKSKPLIRHVMSGGSEVAELQMDAVHRRGRSIALRVTVTPLLPVQPEQPEQSAS